MEIKATNVNQALATALHWLAVDSLQEESRNGPVLVFKEPVLTTYQYPCERVLFSPLRDANPFFHLMESLWMLAGRNDVEWITQFNSKFAEFSDDGRFYHGAYGYRWRRHFGYDQLAVLAEELERNPTSRRCVLTMWDAAQHTLGYDDLHYAVTPGTKDAPCNTHVYVDARNNQLNMTVCCRSNDIWWGAYGANAVHFSMLQEVLAAWVGVPVGRLCQLSNNLHLYPSLSGIGSNPEELKRVAVNCEVSDIYIAAFTNCVTPYPVVGRTPIDLWFKDLEQFLRNPLPLRGFAWRSNFFKDVAVPMYHAWIVRKHKAGTGIRECGSIAATDWRMACTAWITRREQRANAMGRPATTSR